MIIIILIILVVALYALKYVPGRGIYIVERFGTYNRLLKPGVNVVLPFVERVVYSCSENNHLEYCRNKMTIKIDYSVDNYVDVYYQFGDINKFLHSLVNIYIDRVDKESNHDTVESIRDLINSALENTGIEVTNIEIY